MKRTSGPVVAGVMDIVIGLIVGLIGITIGLLMIGFSSMDTTDTSRKLSVKTGMSAICISIAYGFFTIYGGIISIKRKKWGMALVASILSALTFIGIPALIYVVIAKKEFT